MAVMQTDAAQIVDEAVKLRNSAKQQGTKDLQKTRLCVYNLQGKCGLGSACAFAHSSSEVRSAPDLKKTQLCAKFAEGKCTDKNCSFAHGEEELRTPPNFKRKLCKWNAKGLCRNGAKCGFAHDIKELRASLAESLAPVATKAPLRAPPGLENGCGPNIMSAPPMQDEALFRMAAGRGAAPLQQQVTMMSSAIGALQSKLAQLEGMMVQTQVQQLQQDIQQLSGQCWALEAGLSMTEQAAPAMNPTPLKSRLNTKAAPFMPCAFVGDSVSDDSTSVGSD